MWQHAYDEGASFDESIFIGNLLQIARWILFIVVKLSVYAGGALEETLHFERNEWL
ncbi:MAG: hypothetical protein ACREOI_05430 [bacterium]